MAEPAMIVVAGLGCRGACAAEAIVRLVTQASARAGCAPTILAVPHFKAAGPGVMQAASILRLPVQIIDQAALQRAQPRTVTRSATALAATGLASVAEAAALAAAGEGATLLLPRIAGAGATCALARGRA